MWQSYNIVLYFTAYLKVPLEFFEKSLVSVQMPERLCKYKSVASQEDIH